MIHFFILCLGLIFHPGMDRDFNTGLNPRFLTGRDTTIWVTATAYNAIEAQTKTGNVGVGAWGDKLSEDMNVIAVSQDLIKMGLTYKTEVRIQGLKGVYTVMDKMHYRWTRKIDIFMGKDREAAIQWGKRKVKITFPVPE
jgi:3D (Asp-Asp-Asp) domain-containing protein